MAKQLILTIGDTALRVVCQPVSDLSDVPDILDDMADTLHATTIGVALAAPQIGITTRIVVIDYGASLIELINPEIIEKSGSQIDSEVCLSLPGLYGKVKRAKYVKVKALNRSGDELVIEAKGFLARCLQHELDHLDGILYIDHIEPGHLFNELTKEPIDVLAMIKYSNKDTSQ
jgi:peptide deformylase